MSISVKLFSGKTLTRGISATINDFLVNSEIIEIPVNSGDNYDNLCLKCAIKCRISPVHLSMFAIWNPDDGIWMNMNKTVDTHHTRLEFRIRFVVKTEDYVQGEKKFAKRWSHSIDTQIPFMDDYVLAYYYRQRRNDFLLDKIMLNFNDPPQINDLLTAFGIMTLDMFCVSKAANVKISAVKHQMKFKNFLPKSCRQFMSEICKQTIKIETKFNQYWKQFLPVAKNWERGGHRLAFFHQRYLASLEKSTVFYGVERYKLFESGYVSISADSGIGFHNDYETGNIDIWCNFLELTDMSLKFPDNRITIGKFDGKVKQFTLTSIDATENFASCVNGYYNLLVDAHYYLCKEITSPLFIDRLNLGCHGPISCSFAEDVLKKREVKGIVEVGDCVVRQTDTSHQEYYVNVVCNISPIEIRNFKLDRNQYGKLGIFGMNESYKYENLRDLFAACKGGLFEEVEIPINPDKIVFPLSRQRSNLTVCLCSSLEDGEMGNYNVRGIVPSTALIKLEDYSHVRYLGSSHFTDVKRYTKRGETDKYIVFKTIIDQDINTAESKALNDHINVSLQDSTAILNRLNHEHIIQHIGMTLTNMLAFEYLRFGSITTYLQSDRKNQIAQNSTWLLQVIVQLSRACHYLEDLDFAHGNLQGKNILLQNDYPQPHIKLADAGVLTRIRTVEVSKSCKRMVVESRLTTPWLAYEFCSIDDFPNFNNYPTIEGDKWSFATTCSEILNFGQITVDPMNGNEMTEKMKSYYRNGNLHECLSLPDLIKDNEILYKLVCSCWSKNPHIRPSFHTILRELGSALASDHALAPLPSGPVCDIMVEIEHDIPTYEDEKLTCRRSLGQGHFGWVELCAYDQYRNNKYELVAVKRSKLPINKRLQEFTQEIETMKKLDHPYVVRLLGVATPSNRIVMEYLENGSLAVNLKEYKRNGRKRPLTTLMQFSSQIAEGMVALQQKRLIHRDLALRNILLGNDTDNPHIKISDFGLSRFLGENMDAYVGNLIEFPSEWYPPECLCKDPCIAFQFESDVWSYGVTLWEMFSYADKPHYENVPVIRYREHLTHLHDSLKNNDRLKKPKDCPSDIYQIMMQCWAYTPKDRLSFVEIKSKLDDMLPHAEQLPL